MVLYVENTISHGREGQGIQNYYPLDLKYDVDDVTEGSQRVFMEALKTFSIQEMATGVSLDK